MPVKNKELAEFPHTAQARIYPVSGCVWCGRGAAQCRGCPVCWRPRGAQCL